jgi:hypothetical protein
MKRIIEREKPLEEKLSHLFEEKKRIAAIATVAAVNQLALKTQRINSA